MFETARSIRKKYDVSAQLLRKWANTGKLQSIRTKYQRLYNSAQLRTLVGDTNAADDGTNSQTRTTALYARVSSIHQKADLDRQVTDLQATFPTASVITDVGSGLNFHRAGFKALLGRVLQGEIGRVVVTHRDRLCRFAIELVEWLLEQFDTELVVLSADAPSDAAHELADDFLAISNFYVASVNGRRSAENRKRRREAEVASESERGQDDAEEVAVRPQKRQAASRNRQDHQDVPHSATALHASPMDGRGAVDIQQGTGASQQQGGAI